MQPSFPVCETIVRTKDVEEDFANCKQTKVEVCTQRSGCPTVPKLSCQLTKRNVTKSYSDTQVQPGLSRQFLPMFEKAKCL